MAASAALYHGRTEDEVQARLGPTRGGPPPVFLYPPRAFPREPASRGGQPVRGVLARGRWFVTRLPLGDSPCGTGRQCAQPRPYCWWIHSPGTFAGNAGK